MANQRSCFVALMGVGFVSLMILATASAQTIDLGQDVFYNDEGEITMAADAGLAVRRLDSPYIMFMVYMVAKGGQSLTVNRDSVTMVYKGKDFKMPPLKELRDQYKGELNDMNTYRRLGKESLVLSRMRFYTFPADTDFFPVLGTRGSLPVDEGSMTGQIGFSTKFYFKNPGFKKGDDLVLKVHDKKNPEITGSVTVVLQ